MRLHLVGKTNYDQPCINTITVQTKEGRKIVLDREQTYYRYDEEGFVEMDWNGVYDYTSGDEKDIKEEDLKGAIVTDVEIEDDLSTPSDYYFIVVRCVVISDSMKTSDNFSLEVKVSKEQVLYQLNGLYNDIYRSFSGQYMTFRKSLEEILKDFEHIKANISELDEKPGAIEFLQHAKAMCKNDECEKCPFDTKQDECEICNRVLHKTDKEIADFIGAVENWHKENHQKITAKFQIGDKVRVEDGSNIKSYFDGWCMSNLVGLVGEITRIHMDDKFDCAGYELKFENIDIPQANLDLVYDERGLTLVEGGKQ